MDTQRDNTPAKPQTPIGQSIDVTARRALRKKIVTKTHVFAMRPSFLLAGATKSNTVTTELPGEEAQSP